MAGNLLVHSQTVTGGSMSSPNPAAHALHVTCVELMALAVSGQDVGNALLNVVLKSVYPVSCHKIQCLREWYFIWAMRHTHCPARAHWIVSILGSRSCLSDKGDMEWALNSQKTWICSTLLFISCLTFNLGIMLTSP